MARAKATHQLRKVNHRIERIQWASTHAAPGATRRPDHRSAKRIATARGGSTVSAHISQPQSSNHSVEDPLRTKTNLSIYSSGWNMISANHACIMCPHTISLSGSSIEKARFQNHFPIP
ncbi:hypothetical protein OIU76_030229 [Salix suchowensis]|nr:hypothetical protein OIU76_030229 [Salix suchowensis]